MSVEDKDDRQVEQLEENGSAEGEASETDWQAEAQKNQDLFLRAKAEMDNLRKRLEREKADFLKYANEALIKDLLPLLDNLDRALVQARACDIKDEGLVEGVRLTQEGVMSVLENSVCPEWPRLGSRSTQIFTKRSCSAKTLTSKPIRWWRRFRRVTCCTTG